MDNNLNSTTRMSETEMFKVGTWGSQGYGSKFSIKDLF